MNSRHSRGTSGAGGSEAGWMVEEALIAFRLNIDLSGGGLFTDKIMQSIAELSGQTMAAVDAGEHKAEARRRRDA